MLIPFWFIKYVVAFNIVYWPVRQIASDRVSIWLAFASWPVMWWLARRRRLRLFYEGMVRQQIEEEGAALAEVQAAQGLAPENVD